MWFGVIWILWFSVARHSMDIGLDAPSILVVFPCCENDLVSHCATKSLIVNFLSVSILVFVVVVVGGMHLLNYSFNIIYFPELLPNILFFALPRSQQIL